MNRTATIHPTPKVKTLTVPVNAPSAMQAEQAIRETLATNGWTLVEGRSVVTHVEAARPFGDVAIDFPGSTQCYVMRVEYEAVSRA